MSLKRRGVAGDGLAVQEFLPGQHHRGAVIAHRAGEDDLVARDRGRARNPGAQNQTHAGSGNEDLVRRAPGHHLGVAGGDLDAALRRGLVHGRGNGLQDIDLQTLFQDEGGGQGQGPGRSGEQVVHRARHRQAADVAAGKEERVHHEGIGGEGQPVGAEDQGGAVVTGEVRGAVAGQKDLFDERGHLFAAGPVTQKNMFHDYFLVRPTKTGPKLLSGKMVAPVALQL